MDMFMYNLASFGWLFQFPIFNPPPGLM